MPVVRTEDGFQFHTERVVSIEAVDPKQRWCAGSKSLVTFQSGGGLYLRETPEELEELVRAASSRETTVPEPGFQPGGEDTADASA